MRVRHAWVALVAAALANAAPPVTLAAPTDWRMAPTGSQLTFVPRLAGGEFTGRFERFDTILRFDPADLAGSSLQVTVDLLSARTGDADRDAALQGADFFATARWPQGRFTSTSIRALGGQRYEATGRLTLREVTREVSVPFRFEPGVPAKGKARITGQTTVRRLPFGVGQGEWRGTEWLDDDVRVEFSVTLQSAH